MADRLQDKAARDAEVKAIFERARRADIRKVVGTKLYGGGRRLRGECPLCGRGKGDGSAGPFSINASTGNWCCFGCGAGSAKGAYGGGDLIELEHLLRGVGGETLLDAARRLAGGELRPARPAAKAESSPRPRDGGEDWTAAVSVRLWREAGPAEGTPVETYLRARGLFGPVLAAMLRQARYHPAAYHSGPAAAPVLLPAMVFAVHSPLGWTGGVHATYLAPDGRGKAARVPAKKMWGPQAHEGADGEALWGACWLTHPQADGPLVVGEGVESTGSAAILLDQPCRAVATLSLNRLQGGWKADRWGRRALEVVEADPEHPPFTWPEPASASWDEVLVAVDLDMKPVEVRARKALGGTYKARLDATARARICGALASQAWRQATAKPVRVIAPAVVGRDFNDELRARIARGDVRVAA